MAQEPQEGKGVLFSNKKTKDSQPDWRGSVMHNGEIIKIAGWTKKSAYGELVSLTVEKPFDANQQQYPKDVTKKYDSDVPF
jgi:hypothetical protein